MSCIQTLFVLTFPATSEDSTRFLTWIFRLKCNKNNCKNKWHKRILYILERGFRMSWHANIVIWNSVHYYEFNTQFSLPHVVRSLNPELCSPQVRQRFHYRKLLLQDWVQNCSKQARNKLKRLGCSNNYGNGYAKWVKFHNCSVLQ